MHGRTALEIINNDLKIQKIQQTMTKSFGQFSRYDEQNLFDNMTCPDL